MNILSESVGCYNTVFFFLPSLITSQFKHKIQHYERKRELSVSTQVILLLLYSAPKLYLGALYQMWVCKLSQELCQTHPHYTIILYRKASSNSLFHKNNNTYVQSTSDIYVLSPVFYPLIAT